ncbi:MAG: hemolysin family protein [Gammaproteobacteria bacterium]|nr:hemolysin family protein [Gammaproteobacteria bacterium]
MFAEFADSINTLLANPPRLLQLDMILRILLQLFLFSASAFFSGSETALFSLTRFDLQKLSRSKHAAADTLQKLLDQPRRLIVSILCGNELVNIAAAANMTAILVELAGVETGALLATALMIPLILLFGEVTPKTLAVSNPAWVSTRIVARPLNSWIRLIRPLANVVRLVADKVTTLLIGPERTRENILYIEELRSLIEEGVQSGEITPTERTLVHSLLSAGATEVREIMTPRPQVQFLDGEMEPSDLRAAFIKLRHTRVPVFVGGSDNIVGFLCVEDFLEEPAQKSDSVNKEGGYLLAGLPLLHPPIAVPPTKEVDEMLDFFEEHSASAALVVNEFGSVDGIVTLDDVTKFLFNGVYSEPVINVEEIREVAGGYEIEASTPLSEIRDVTGMDIPEKLMTTIAGTALRNFGVVPKVGDRIEIEGFSLEILEMDNLRISRVRLLRRPSESVESEGEGKIGHE